MRTWFDLYILSGVALFSLINKLTRMMKPVIYRSNNSETVEPNSMKIASDTDLGLLYISSFQLNLIGSTVQPEIAPRVTAGARAPSFVDVVV